MAGKMCQSTLAINLRSVVVVRGGSSSVCELAWLSPLSIGSFNSARGNQTVSWCFGR
jgi:hypothetical protein